MIEILQKFLITLHNLHLVESAFYKLDFEATQVGPENGQRVTDELPFCGRTSFKNPGYLWRTGYTEIKAGIKVQAYNAETYKYVSIS